MSGHPPACWEVIKGITIGDDLRTTLGRVIRIAVQWKPPTLPKAKGKT